MVVAEELVVNVRGQDINASGTLSSVHTQMNNLQQQAGQMGNSVASSSQQASSSIKGIGEANSFVSGTFSSASSAGQSAFTSISDKIGSARSSLDNFNSGIGMTGQLMTSAFGAIGMGGIIQGTVGLALSRERMTALMTATMGTKQEAESFIGTLDELTNSSLVSLDVIGQAVNTTKMSTGMSNTELKLTTPLLNEIGQRAILMGKNSGEVQRMMNSAYKGLNGNLQMLKDDFGVTKDKLMEMGWSGASNDVKGYTDAFMKFLQQSGSMDGMMQTLPGRIEVMKKGFRIAGRELGEMVTPYISGLVNWLLQLKEVSPGAFKGIIAGAAAIAGFAMLSPILSPALGLVQSLFDGMGKLHDKIRGVNRITQDNKMANTLSQQTTAQQILNTAKGAEPNNTADIIAETQARRNNAAAMVAEKNGLDGKSSKQSNMNLNNSKNDGYLFGGERYNSSGNRIAMSAQERVDYNLANKNPKILPMEFGMTGYENYKNTINDSLHKSNIKTGAMPGGMGGFYNLSPEMQKSTKGFGTSWKNNFDVFKSGTTGMKGNIKAFGQASTTSMNSVFNTIKSGASSAGSKIGQMGTALTGLPLPALAVAAAVGAVGVGMHLAKEEFEVWGESTSKYNKEVGEMNLQIKQRGEWINQEKTRINEMQEQLKKGNLTLEERKRLQANILSKTNEIKQSEMEIAAIRAKQVFVANFGSEMKSVGQQKMESKDSKGNKIVETLDEKINRLQPQTDFTGKKQDVGKTQIEDSRFQANYDRLYENKQQAAFFGNRFAEKGNVNDLAKYNLLTKNVASIVKYDEEGKSVGALNSADEKAVRADNQYARFQSDLAHGWGSIFGDETAKNNAEAYGKYTKQLDQNKALETLSKGQKQDPSNDGNKNTLESYIAQMKKLDKNYDMTKDSNLKSLSEKNPALKKQVQQEAYRQQGTQLTDQQRWDRDEKKGVGHNMWDTKNWGPFFNSLGKDIKKPFDEVGKSVDGIFGGKGKSGLMGGLKGLFGLDGKEGGISGAIKGGASAMGIKLPNWGKLLPKMPKWGNLIPKLPSWGKLLPKMPKWTSLLPTLPKWTSLLPTLPDWTGLIPGMGGGKATGGRVFGGKAGVVGENGPELFVPNQDGQIYPNSYMKYLNNNGDANAKSIQIDNSKTVHLTIQVDSGNANEIGQIVRREVMKVM